MNQVDFSNIHQQITAIPTLSHKVTTITPQPLTTVTICKITGRALIILPLENSNKIVGFVKPIQNMEKSQE